MAISVLFLLPFWPAALTTTITQSVVGNLLKKLWEQQKRTWQGCIYRKSDFFLVFSLTYQQCARCWTQTFRLRGKLERKWGKLTRFWSNYHTWFIWNIPGKFCPWFGLYLPTQRLDFRLIQPSSSNAMQTVPNWGCRDVFLVSVRMNTLKNTITEELNQLKPWWWIPAFGVTDTA